MRERPILFSGPMVRAILEGRKTQTRRVMNPQPNPHTTRMDPMIPKIRFAGATQKELDEIHGACFTSHGPMYVGKIPEKVTNREIEYDWHEARWAVLDRLWVKETFHSMPHLNAKAYFRATDPLVGVNKWTPSIFMPRVVSRLTLEIAEIRMEPLQEITTADAQAEGIERVGIGWRDYQSNGSFDESVPVASFKSLWNSNGKKYPWASNPWVWVVTFKPL